MDKSPFSYTIKPTRKRYTVITLQHVPETKDEKPISIKIAPELGSNLFSIHYDGQEIIHTEQDVLEQAGFTGTYVLFPTPNRVKDFTYTWKGKSHTLMKNGKPVDIHHQLVYDQPWHYTVPTVAHDHVSVETSITINAHSHLFDGFPFPCTLTLRYELRPDSVRIAYTIANDGDRDLPFGFGLHPHFARLCGNENTLISIPADFFMENYPDTMLPNGVLVPVSGETDIRRPTPVGRLNLDHVFTGLTPQKHAIVEYRDLGFRVALRASDDCTHTVVWSGHPQAVCIENQTCATDAHNLYSRGFTRQSHLLTVPPGASHSGYIAYEMQRL